MPDQTRAGNKIIFIAVAAVCLIIVIVVFVISISIVIACAIDDAGLLLCFSVFFSLFIFGFVFTAVIQ